MRGGGAPREGADHGEGQNSGRGRSSGGAAVRTELERAGKRGELVAVMRRLALGKLLGAGLGDYRQALDLPGRRIVFAGDSGRITARADLIAVGSESTMTFRWGWSRELTRAFDVGPPPDDMLRFGTKHAVPVLTTPEFRIDVRPREDDSAALQATLARAGFVAAEVFGPDAVYVLHATSADTILLLLVRDLSEELPEITLRDFAELLRFRTLAVDGQEAALGGLADCVPGWSMAVSARTRNRVVFDVTDGAGGIVEVQRRYDRGLWDQDVSFRVGRISMPGGPGPEDPPRRRGLLATMFGEHGPRKVWDKPPPAPAAGDPRGPEGSEFQSTGGTRVRLAVLDVHRQEPDTVVLSAAASGAAGTPATVDVHAEGVARWRQVLEVLGALSEEEAAGAEPERIEEMERRRGLLLAEDHRRYLAAQNGWEPVAGAPADAVDLRIASLEELDGDAMRTCFGHTLEGLADLEVAEELRGLGIDPGNCLTVAVEPFYGASCVMPVREGRVGPEVVEVVGWVEESLFLGAVHPSFSAFLDAAATSAERSVAAAEERDRQSARRDQAWRASVAIRVDGVPDYDAELARKIVRLLKNLHEIRPVGPWRITGRPWDGRTKDLERVIAEARRPGPDGTEKLYLALMAGLGDGGRWQVSFSRTRPAADDDHLLILLTAGRPEDEPRPDLLDIFLLQVIADFDSSCVTASSVSANRAAIEQGIPSPHGFRIWLPASRLGPEAMAVEPGAFDLRPLGSGILLSGPDERTPQQIVQESHALVIRLGEGA